MSVFDVREALDRDELEQFIDAQYRENTFIPSDTTDTTDNDIESDKRSQGWQEARKKKRRLASGTPNHHISFSEML